MPFVPVRERLKFLGGQNGRYSGKELKMPDPLFSGDWKLDTGKSQLSALSFNPNQEVRRYEEIPNGYKLTVTGSSGGQGYSWNYTALYDGQPHPVQGRSDVDAITAYRVDDKVTLGLFSKAGVDGGAYARRVSMNGKTLTVFAGGKDVNGAPYFDILHYDL